VYCGESDEAMVTVEPSKEQSLRRYRAWKVMTIIEQLVLGSWLLLSAVYRVVGVAFMWIDEHVNHRLEILLSGGELSTPPASVPLVRVAPIKGESSMSSVPAVPDNVAPAARGWSSIGECVDCAQAVWPYGTSLGCQLWVGGPVRGRNITP
jgi:hypothetical protein